MMYLEWPKSETLEMRGTVFTIDESFDHEHGTESGYRLEVTDFSVWSWIPDLEEWYQLRLKGKQLEDRKAEFLEWASKINFKESA